MHRTVPLDKDLPSLIVSSAEVKKPLQQSRGKKQQNREKKFNKDQKHFKTTLLMQPYVFSDSRQVLKEIQNRANTRDCLYRTGNLPVSNFYFPL